MQRQTIGPPSWFLSCHVDLPRCQPSNLVPTFSQSKFQDYERTNKSRIIFFPCHCTLYMNYNCTCKSSGRNCPFGRPRILFLFSCSYYSNLNQGAYIRFPVRKGISGLPYAPERVDEVSVVGQTEQNRWSFDTDSYAINKWERESCHVTLTAVWHYQKYCFEYSVDLLAHAKLEWHGQFFRRSFPHITLFESARKKIFCSGIFLRPAVSFISPN